MQRPPNPPLFASDRERRLWLSVLVVLVAIYSTLGLAGVLARRLSQLDQRWVDHATFAAFVAAIVIGVWVKWRPGRREIGVVVGVAFVYLWTLARMASATAAERTHLAEYGVVALLIHQALAERRRSGRRIPAPAVLAVVMTALLGWLDEGIQAFLPNRVYDLRDVGFNALAGLMAVGASMAVGWARRGDQKDREGAGT